MQVIDSAERYFQVLKENAEEDKIVVIKIYAGFCRACKAFDRKFRLLSLDFQEQGANVKFFEMDWMKTRDLCKSLQVGEGGRGSRGGWMEGWGGEGCAVSSGFVLRVVKLDSVVLGGS